MGTIVALLFAILLQISAISFSTDRFLLPVFFPFLIGVFPLVVVVIQGLSLSFAWSPLQMAEQNLTSRILEMFQKDHFFRLFNGWIIFFLLVSIAIAFDLMVLYFIPQKILISIWFIFFGFTLDLLYHYYKRITMYLDPFSVVKIFEKEAKNSIKEEHEQELCDWIDALAEIGNKSISTKGTSLCVHCVEALEVISHNFLESQKSISHQNEDPESKAMGIKDKVSFTLFYIFQRLESINDHAIKSNLEPITNLMISILGRIAIYGAQFDLSLASYPLHFLAKFAKKAQDHHFPEVGVKASLTLVEVSKKILSDIDLTYCDLQDPFLNIINHLEEIAKNAFRHEKNLPISVLTQPLRNLRELFAAPKVANHRDTPLIIQNIDRALGEFATLEQILKTIPPIPKMEENGNAEERTRQ